MSLPIGQKVSRPALRYRGGKWRSAPWIIEHFPPHECYVEPFMGAASVLLRKPRADFECINDLNGSVVNFFRVLREQPAELQQAITLTPYSRQEYRECRVPCPGNPIEWARRLWVQHSQGRGRAEGANGGWRFQTAWNGWNADVVGQFRKVEHFTEITDRLMGVQIEQGTWIDVVRRFDRPSTLFYVDPPYPHVTRPESTNLYAHEMEDADHERLAGELNGLDGMVVLSSYPNALYDSLFAGWRQEVRTEHAEAQKETTEVIYLNPACDTALRAATAQIDFLEALRG